MRSIFTAIGVGIFCAIYGPPSVPPIEQLLGMLCLCGAFLINMKD